MAAHLISSALSRPLVFHERLPQLYLTNSIQDGFRQRGKAREIRVLLSEVYSTLSNSGRWRWCKVRVSVVAGGDHKTHNNTSHYHHRAVALTQSSQFWTLCRWRRSPRWTGDGVGAVRWTCFTSPLDTYTSIRSVFTSEAHHKTVDTSEQSRNVASWEVVKKESRIRGAGNYLIGDFKETKAKVREKMDEIIERENIWTVPNLLCVSRICLSPVLSYLVLCSNYHWSLALFMLAGFTDLLDGWIARTFPSQASNLGSFLDPLADKVLVALLFLSLTYVGLIPLPLTGVIIYRDVLIIGGASFVRYKSLPPPRTISRYFDASHATARLAPTPISKINTAVQLSLITASLAAPVFSCTDHILIKALWWLTAATTLSSGLSYIFSRDTYKFLRTMDQQHREK